MYREKESVVLRWWVLVMTLINIVFYPLAAGTLLMPQDVGVISDRYKTYFTPADYAFSIWGVIYLSFIVYGIYQLLPAQRTRALYDRIAPQLIAASLLGMLWQVVFTHERLLLSVGVIMVMLVLAVVMYQKVNKATASTMYPLWLRIPFSLYMGWLSVAVIANGGA